MKNILSVFIVFVFVLHSGVVLAYGNKLYMEHNGVKGYWFDEPTVDLILSDLSELSILRKRKIPAFEKKIYLQELTLDKYEVLTETSEDISKRYKKALKKSEENYEYLEKKYLDALDRNDKWYKSPSILFICGIISGGLLAVGLSFGLKGN